MYYALRIPVAAGLAAASFLSFRSARADLEFRRQDPESVAESVALEPGNTEYLQFRALQLDYEGSDSTALLERAAGLNPMSSAPRIRLGLAAETRRDFPAAEKWLLGASQIDRQFEPRWTLANFYFRRGDRQKFWSWIRSALEMSYGDRTPAFDLCWRMSGDAPEILQRAIPEQHEVLSSYVAYLLAAGKSDAAGSAAMKLAPARNAPDRDLLLAVADALIAAQSADAAWSLWTAAGFGGVNFESPRVDRAFDWLRIASPGVAHLDIDQPRSAHRITLNGNQPESCDLLRRVLKLEPGLRYTLSWQSEPQPSGVEWRIAGQRAALKDRELQFNAPAELVTLTLAYERPHGEVRAEESFEIWNIEIR